MSIFLFYIHIRFNIFNIILQKLTVQTVWMYLQFKLSECTYSSNSLTVPRVAIGIKSSWDCNYFRKDIDLIIIKVNHHCQYFSFISTFVSIYYLIISKVNNYCRNFSFISTFVSIYSTLSYRTYSSNCLNVLTVQTVLQFLELQLV